MDKTERIVNRLPNFYRAWDKRSALFRLLNSFAKRLDEQQKDLFKIMRSHWIDTSDGVDIDHLGSIFNIKRKINELDDDFRRRIKLVIAEFRGGGTVAAVTTQLRIFLDLKENEKVELVENPAVQLHFEKNVKNRDTWSMNSASINDEVAAMTLALQDKDSELLDPVISDPESKFSIKFKGSIKSGQRLVIKEDGKSELDGNDVSNKLEILANAPEIKILRRGSIWMYHESLSDRIGRFDESRFDEHVFETSVPTATLRFEWIAHLLATFEVKVPSTYLIRNGISKKQLEDAIEIIKAAGVKAVVTLLD